MLSLTVMLMIMLMMMLMTVLIMRGMNKLKKMR